MTLGIITARKKKENSVQLKASKHHLSQHQPAKPHSFNASPTPFADALYIIPHRRQVPHRAPRIHVLRNIIQPHRAPPRAPPPIRRTSLHRNLLRQHYPTSHPTEPLIITPVRTHQPPLIHLPEPVAHLQLVILRQRADAFPTPPAAARRRREDLGRVVVRVVAIPRRPTRTGVDVGLGAAGDGAAEEAGEEVREERLDGGEAAADDADGLLDGSDEEE